MDLAQQTQRLHILAALAWTLGLSYRALVGLLAVFRTRLSRMSARQDLQERAEQLRKQRKWQAVRVLGVDGAYGRGWGAQQKVLIAVDLGAGQPVSIGYVDEHDPQDVKRWVGKLLKELRETIPKEQLWILDEVKLLMDNLAPEGSCRLLELYRQLPACQTAVDQPRIPIEQLRLLLVRLSEDRANYRIFD